MNAKRKSNLYVSIFAICTLLLSACLSSKTDNQQDYIQTQTIPTISPSQTSPLSEVAKTPLIQSQPTLVDFISPDPGPVNHNQTRHLIAIRAAELATKSMPGEYSWEEFRSCSTFASAYLRQLSFPVADLYGVYADHPDPVPFSGVVSQVDWFRRNYPQYTHDQSLENFLSGNLWSQIPVGSLIYMQTSTGHNGYNTYYHVVVLVDYQNNQPIFAEIASNMANASINRSFEQITSFYRQYADGGWDISPYPVNETNNPLIVTWVDPLEILNHGDLWRKNTPIIPNSTILDKNFDQVVTININNGLLAIFKKDSLSWQPVTVEGKTHFYTVVGRRLPANNTITKNYYDRQPGVYDGDFGVYISPHGIYQDTWTPPLLSELTGFERLSNFGGLGGSTDTSLLKPLVYNENKNVEHYYDYSPFTFHLIPDVVNQDTLLRADLITQANTYGQPVPQPDVYLSSGCINLDQATWQMIKIYLQQQINQGQRIAVVFSYPHMDQDLLPYTDLFQSPFTSSIFNKWCPTNNILRPCDPLDRSKYRDTYLTNK